VQTLVRTVPPVIHQQYAPAYIGLPPAASRKPWFRRTPFLASAAGVIGLVTLLLLTGILTVVHQSNDPQAIAARTTVQTPLVIDGWPRNTTDRAYPLLAPVGASLNLTNFVYGSYSKGLNQPAVLLAYVGKRAIANDAPRPELDAFEAALIRGFGVPVNWSPVDAGPLGGYMDCGIVTLHGEAPFRECVFADTAVMGAIAQYRSEETDTSLPVAVRSKIEIRH
jgi:hypothetical protein